ncbi:Hypothetical protein ADU71_1316 [Pediococcus damnosus]|uniref:hypothetical protein n=1 Tax=Pediococcus damnosus TaxID=51663 RepID=UPI00078E1B18|nr:hypothetical protein [Pediococcus damnosus]AMV65212.1 Hypothetical protein ADU71_1316 [Pediococcus damnosus]
MINNIFKNLSWLVTSLEAVSISVWFEFSQAGFIPFYSHFPPRAFNGFLIRMDDPYIPLIIGLIGMFGLIVSLWDLHTWNADTIRNGLFTFLYLFSTILFAFHELGIDEHIGAMTLLCGITTIRVVLQWIKDSLIERKLIEQLGR